jgi:hypothetical protein
MKFQLLGFRKLEVGENGFPGPIGIQLSPHPQCFEAPLKRSESLARKAGAPKYRILPRNYFNINS